MKYFFKELINKLFNEIHLGLNFVILFRVEQEFKR